MEMEKELAGAQLAGEIPPCQPKNITPPPNTLDSDESDVDDPDDLSDFGDMLRDTQQSPPLTQEESVRRSGALFILKTAEERRLTLTAVNGIIQDIQLLIETVVDTVEARVMETLQNSTTDSDEIDSVRACFHDKVLVHPFYGIETEFFQMKYFTESMSLIVSIYTPLPLPCCLIAVLVQHC